MPIGPRPHHALIFIDGACSGNPGPASIGIVIQDGRRPRSLARYLGPATNNIAEYLALVYALQEALRLRYRDLTVKSDSELLVRQMQGTYKVRDPQLRVLHDLAAHLAAAFRTVRLEHIPREQNRAADRLAGRALAAQRSSGDWEVQEPTDVQKTW